MSNFKIPKIPATTSKSIRFPNDMIDEVEENICTFSAFVVAAVQAALDDLREQREQT